MSRRNLLRAGTCILVGNSSLIGSTDVLDEENRASAKPGEAAMMKQLIRTYNSGYEKKNC
jgi:hypothetical protein